MGRFQERLQHGDRVFREVLGGGGREEGKVEQRISRRTKKPYLVVVFTSGPRKGQWEFPNRGRWEVDLTYNPAFDRPESEEPSYSLKQTEAYSRIRREAKERQARGERPLIRHPRYCEKCRRQLTDAQGIALVDIRAHGVIGPWVCETCPEPAPKHPPTCTCDDCGPF